MKQTRRGFLGTFAAIAAAVAVSPSAKADAAPPESLRIVRPAPDQSWVVEVDPSLLTVAGSVMVSGPLTIEPMTVVPVMGRVTPLTFEAMQQDCAGRGCALEEHHRVNGYTVVHLNPGSELWQHFDEGAHRSPMTPFGLARVDAWRRGLHEQDDLEAAFVSAAFHHAETVNRELTIEDYRRAWKALEDAGAIERLT